MLKVEPLVDIRAPIAEWLADPFWIDGGKPLEATRLERVKFLAEVGCSYNVAVAASILSGAWEYHAMCWVATRSQAEMRTILDLANAEADMLAAREEEPVVDDDDRLDIEMRRAELARVRSAFVGLIETAP